MQVVKQVVMAAALMIVTSTLTNPASAQEKLVNVYGWRDYIDPSVLESFTKETGIKVVYDTMDSDEILETKLYAGRSGYDIVDPTGPNLRREIAAGVFQQLDKSKIPNLIYGWDKIFDRLAFYDPGNKYAVNYMWGTTGIGYNVEKARERMGSVPMDSWSLVFQPENIAKFADCGVYFVDSPDDLLAVTLKYLGRDPDSKNTSDIADAAEVLAKIRKYIKKFDSSAYISALASGDICLVVGWSGDVIQARSRASEAHSKAPDKPLVEINYVIPREGSLIWVDGWSIPRDAPHPDEAHAFINYMMRPDVAARNTNYISYANGNLAAQKLVDPGILKDTAIYPDEGTMAQLFTTTAPDAKIKKMWARAWTRIKTGE
ncbi:putrescine-binding periplasmic protein [Labrys miyagiensis]